MKFEILRKIENIENKTYTKDEIIEYIKKSYTIHLKNDRKERLNTYLSYMKDEIRFVNGFCYLVDKGHKNGYEIHLLSEQGFLFVFNYKTKKLVTILAVSINQTKRINENIPEFLEKNIRSNLKKKLNKI